MFALTLVVPGVASAQSGVLDASFGRDGVVSASIGESAGVAAVAVQPDDALVSVGWAFVGRVRRLAVTRHRADGLVDRRFGSDGVVITEAGGYPEGQAVAIQNDGKILVAGKALIGAAPALLVARYEADGSLDGSFAAGGILLSPTGLFAVNEVAAVAVSPDGKIVVSAVVGQNGENNFGVIRLESDGARDSTFGTEGMVVTQMPAFAAAAGAVRSTAAVPAGMALQPDGKVVVAGALDLDFTHSAGHRIGLVRYTAAGALDQDFGSNGILITGLGTSSRAAVGRQQDGKLVAVGTAGDGGGGLALARYHPDGSLDTAFGSGGTVRTVWPNLSDPSGVLFEPDGKIVANASANLASNSRGILLARYLSDGRPDESFGTNGVTTAATGRLFVLTGPTANHYTLVCNFRCAAPIVRQHNGGLVAGDTARDAEDQQPTFRLLRFADSSESDDAQNPPAQLTTTTTAGPAGSGADFPAPAALPDGASAAEPTRVLVPTVAVGRGGTPSAKTDTPRPSVPIGAPSDAQTTGPTLASPLVSSPPAGLNETAGSAVDHAATGRSGRGGTFAATVGALAAVSVVLFEIRRRRRGRYAK